jgi:hypothetical protein
MNKVIPLNQLVVEIKFYSQQTALNMIEVGKRLIQAKEQVDHGGWEKWLIDNVDISYRSAVRLMQIAKECSNLPTLATLPTSKVIAILDLPIEQRQPFIEQNHVDEMTTRELQKAIKAQKDAEDKAEKLAKSLEQARTKAAAVEDVEEENRMLRQENLKLAKKPPVVIEKEVPTIPDDYESLKSENRQSNMTIQQLAAEKERLAKDLAVEREASKAFAKASTSDYDRHKEFEARADMISGRIELFIKDMAAFGYMGADYFRCTDYSRKRYEKGIERLEKLTRDLREQMQVLSIEGDSKIINAEVIDI